MAEKNYYIIEKPTQTSPTTLIGVNAEGDVANVPKNFSPGSRIIVNDGSGNRKTYVLDSNNTWQPY